MKKKMVVLVLGYALEKWTKEQFYSLSKNLSAPEQISGEDVM